MNQKIIVTIATLGRKKELSRCLDSLVRQTRAPYEVIVMHNGTGDAIRKLCMVYRHRLPIRYVQEKRIGLCFARNRSIRECTGEVIAFLDDDCIASPDWLDSIADHFRITPSVGVIGYTRQLAPANPVSAVIHAYYHRWLLRYVPSLRKTHRLSGGAPVDFRNAAFLSRFIKRFRFNTTLTIIGDDVEVGLRLYETDPRIYYNPSIRVRHSNANSLRAMWLRNVKTGYATGQLLYMCHVPSGNLTQPYNRSEWISGLPGLLTGVRGIHNKLGAIIVFVVYPFGLRWGRMLYALGISSFPPPA